MKYKGEIMMAIISISRVRSGMILKNDVYSSLGGLLYKKGTILQEQDQEILDAFGVLQVEVVDKQIDKDAGANTQLDKNKTNPNRTELTGNTKYQEHYHQVYRLISQIMNAAQGTPQIPVLELRNSIEPLLEDIQKNPLKLLSFHLQKDLNKYDIHHAISVALLAHTTAKWLGIEQGEWMQIALAGLLHDIGIRRIPHRIIGKQKRLDYDEREEIKKHTIYGYQMLKGTKGLNEGVLLAILQHHERNDGSGYPLHLKEEQIHKYSKIIAVADVFHAMISKRSYRAEIPFFNVLDQLHEDSFGKLDPTIVQTFIKMMAKLTLGKTVILDNDIEGVVFLINDLKPTRPWVKVENGIINLEMERGRFIKDILN